MVLHISFVFDKGLRLILSDQTFLTSSGKTLNQLFYFSILLLSLAHVNDLTVHSICYSICNGHVCTIMVQWVTSVWASIILHVPVVAIFLQLLHSCAIFQIIKTATQPKHFFKTSKLLYVVFSMCKTKKISMKYTLTLHNGIMISIPVSTGNFSGKSLFPISLMRPKVVSVSDCKCMYDDMATATILQ